jgi:hypothetical protein
MATEEIAFPSTRLVEKLFSPEGIGAPGEIMGLELPGGAHSEDPLQIRVHLSKGRDGDGPQVMVRTMVNDGGTSYLSQYGGEFKDGAAAALFVNAIVRDVKGE